MADTADKRSFIGLRDLTDAESLAQKRRDTEMLRSAMKKEWALNRAFHAGKQWSYWNPGASRIEDIPSDKGPKWKVRLVSNQIKDGLTHYVSQLTKTRPTIDAEPDSGSDKDVKAAQMAESLFEWTFDDKNLNAQAQAALMEAGLSGGFWKITWDPLAGKPMTFTIGPDGQPILDDGLADAFVDQLELQLQQSGHDPRLAAEMARKTYYMGDIRVETMMAENVLLDPACSRFEDAKWVICKHALDPDEIKARWGKTVQPNATKSADEFPLPFQKPKNEKPAATLREVFIMYIRPNPSLPKGRYVAWIEGPDEILQDMDWPYPFTELPLVKFPGKYRPDSPYDDPIVSEARSIQKELNSTLSQMIEHRRLTLRPQVLAPVGSVRTKLTTESGALIEYNPVGTAVPQWREMPQLPAYVFNQLADIQQRLDRIFNRNPSQRDQLPARTDSGGLLEAMQEGIADNIAPVILRLEDSMARAGHLIASLAQTYYEEPRLLKIRGAGGSVQVKKFEKADIAGGFTFRPRYGTGLPRTREGKRAALMEMHQAQVIDTRQLMKHLDLADLKGVQAQLARDEDFAYRIADKIRRGIPVNIPAAQQAQQELMQFQQQAQQIVQMLQSGQPLDVNNDGMPDDPNEVMQQLQEQFQQLQQAVQDAPFQPFPYENKAATMEVLSDLMKSAEYEAYPPELAAQFEQRFSLTQQAIQAEQPVDPATLPKINVMTKATTSAKVLSKILNAHGIQTDEHEVAELPLDTEVYDSIDKPNQDESANSPMSQADQMLQMQQAQDEHALKQAQAAQAMGLAENAASLSEQKSQQQLDHAEQKHQAAMAQQHQAHQAALAQKAQDGEARRKAAARPKPKGK